MNVFDQKLLAEIEALHNQAEALRQSLYDHHPACVCSPTAVCAFHATLNNHFVAITDEAEAAKTYILNEASSLNEV